MEDKNLIHWRKSGSNQHCGCEILPGGSDIEYIVIDHITYHDKHVVQGVEKEGIWTATFAPNPYTKLPMILNPTNRKLLCKMARTKFPETIKNFPIRLTSEETRMGEGLRISKLPPTLPKKDVLTEKHPNWDKCTTHIKNGGAVSDLESKYTVSPETKKLLEACIQGQKKNG